MKMNEEAIGTLTLDAAFSVHRTLGSGLLESVYEAAMIVELRQLGLHPERQVPIPISYRNEDLGIGFRADLVVNHLGLVELKSVESVTPVFKKNFNYLSIIPTALENWTLGRARPLGAPITHSRAARRSAPIPCSPKSRRRRAKVQNKRDVGLIPLRLGFLINLNEALLKNGITRVVNDLTDSSYSSSRPSRDPTP